MDVDNDADTYYIANEYRNDTYISHLVITTATRPTATHQVLNSYLRAITIRSWCTCILLLHSY